MNGTGNKTVEERVEALERTMRLLCGLFIICGIVFLCREFFQRAVGKIVAANRFVLEDTEGRTRICLDIDNVDDAPCVKLLDRSGRVRINIGLDERSMPGMVFVYDEDCVHTLEKRTLKAVTNNVVPSRQPR